MRNINELSKNEINSVSGGLWGELAVVAGVGTAVGFAGAMCFMGLAAYTLLTHRRR